ncbi:MAG: cupin domain-containing protein [Verrucomicrobia bacterium]|nr:cupin domain-containing protein [Verrucomicrobiota bacterium]
MKKVNLKEKFQLFNAYWTPKILGEINNCYVKIFKAKGELVWHKHDREDEFFLVVKGQLNIKLRDREINLKEGEFFIVPHGVEHLPYAAEEAHVLLFEPKEVINTGDVVSDQTVTDLEWL